MSIAENIEAGRVANDAVELIRELGAEAGLPPESIDRYWERIGKLVDEIRDTQRPPQPNALTSTSMTDDQAKRFEDQRVGFGKYQGHVVGLVPIDYLVWIDDENDFGRKLNRYLKSERGQKRQDERRYSH